MGISRPMSESRYCGWARIPSFTHLTTFKFIHLFCFISQTLEEQINWRKVTKLKRNNNIYPTRGGSGWRRIIQSDMSYMLYVGRISDFHFTIFHHYNQNAIEFRDRVYICSINYKRKTKSRDVYHYYRKFEWYIWNFCRFLSFWKTWLREDELRWRFILENKMEYCITLQQIDLKQFVIGKLMGERELTLCYTTPVVVHTSFKFRILSFFFFFFNGRKPRSLRLERIKERSKTTT